MDEITQCAGTLPAFEVLFALDNVIYTPHVAGATKGSLLRVGTIAATNIVRHLRGKAPDPDNLVR